ncbi:Cell surface protein [Labilithrix luteola]|uniref:Cell surface protein n=1 Tax=Labilithrix luteola TaxID=1391654 RepID=A0A0K1PJ98_9BACT|nr:Cell surface protein [Labilithrix luteola]
MAALAAACGLGFVGSASLDRGGELPPDDDAGRSDAPALDATNDRMPSDVDGSDFDANADVNAPPPLVLRLAVGAPADYTGITYPGLWKASPVPKGGCGPSAYTAGGPLHIQDAPLFENEAFGNPLVCTLGDSLASGTYRVNLYFAEIYFGENCPGGGGKGSRVFDVYLEEQKVISNLDVFAVSGGCLADPDTDAGLPIVRSFDIPITDGTLDIRMPASVNNGKLSALELFGPL